MELCCESIDFCDFEVEKINKASSMKRIIDQECFSCKQIPLIQDGFSRNEIACPEMTYLICEGCVLLIGSND